MTDQPADPNTSDTHIDNVVERLRVKWEREWLQLEQFFSAQEASYVREVYTIIANETVVGRNDCTREVYRLLQEAQFSRKALTQIAGDKQSLQHRVAELTNQLEELRALAKVGEAFLNARTEWRKQGKYLFDGAAWADEALQKAVDEYEVYLKGDKP